MSADAAAERSRLMQVAATLVQAASEPEAGRGKRRLPVVAAGDAAGLVGLMHAQLDQAIEQRDRDAAGAGVVIACDRGCNACCALPVTVGEHEALAVARWLAQPAQVEVRARFVAAYQAWRAALGAIVEAVADATTQETHDEARRAYFARRAMCPFNHQGDCAVYPVRPDVCRTTHALTTKDRCEDQASPVQTMSHPAVEQAYQGQLRLRVTLHAALRPGRAHELLPKAVMRRLTSASAFPNQPCPCGSGHKQRRCCGA